MFHAMMRCSLWDLVDEGIDTVLDRLKGEAGITGISIPLVCGPVDAIRPHKGVSPRTFRSRGGAQFQPHADHYASTRLRPVVAEWLKKSNPLPHVVEACAKRNLSLRGEIECCRSPVMVEKHPFAAVKDAFGEPSPAWLCPVNPDVPQYLQGLLGDLRDSCGIHHVQLHGLQWGPGSIPARDPAGHESPLPSENAMSIIHHLMALCFCESCRQHAETAGVGASGVVREVQHALEKLFASGESRVSVAEFCSDIPGLVEYADLQTRTINALALQPAAKPEPEGFVVNVNIGAGLDSTTLVRLVSEAVERGVRQITFDHYGSMPLVGLAWVRQAVRKAQRDSE